MGYTWTDNATVTGSIVDPDALNANLMHLKYDIGRTWRGNTLFPQNSICLPIVINGYQYASSGGTSAATEPTWPGSGTVTDGTVVWTKQGAVQAIVDDNETYDTEEKKVAAIDLINF